MSSNLSDPLRALSPDTVALGVRASLHGPGGMESGPSDTESVIRSLSTGLRKPPAGQLGDRSRGQPAQWQKVAVSGSGREAGPSPTGFGGVQRTFILPAKMRGLPREDKNNAVISYEISRY